MFQPLLASATRAVEKLRDIGEPLPDDLTSQLAKLADDAQTDAVRSAKVEELLRPYVLADVQIDEQGLTAATQGAALPRLVQHGWRSFLVRVANPHAAAG